MVDLTIFEGQCNTANVQDRRVDGTFFIRTAIYSFRGISKSENPS